MQLTANCYLYARKGSASTEAPHPFYLKPGDTKEITKVVLGTTIDGNSVWYYAPSDDCYYWSGGFAEVDFQIPETDKMVNAGEWHKILQECLAYYWTSWKKNIRGFTGASIGYRIQDGKEKQDNITIIIQVSEKQDWQTNNEGLAPEFVNYRGILVDTDVIEAGKAEFQKIKPGDSLSRKNEQGEWGTVGIKVYRNEKERTVYYLLTNFHVAGFDLLQKGIYVYDYKVDGPLPNREIVSPAADRSTNQTDTIGAFSEGRLSSLLDIALVRLNDGDKMVNQFGDALISNIIDITTDPIKYLNRTVTLYGAKSGVKKSLVKSVSSQQFFRYTGAAEMEMTNLIQVEKYSAGGDSGSAVLLDDAIIGIHVGADNKFSYAIPIKRVLQHFNLIISS